MYYIHYYLNNQSHRYEYAFNSLWAAIFKARAIFEEHGIDTDVMHAMTGEVLAIFQPNHVEVNDDLEVDIQVLALTPLK